MWTGTHSCVLKYMCFLSHMLAHSSSYSVWSEQPTNLISIALSLLNSLFCFFFHFLPEVPSRNRGRIFVFLMSVILLRFLGEYGEIILKQSNTDNFRNIALYSFAQQRNRTENTKITRSYVSDGDVCIFSTLKWSCFLLKYFYFLSLLWPI